MLGSLIAGAASKLLSKAKKKAKKKAQKAKAATKLKADDQGLATVAGANSAAPSNTLMLAGLGGLVAIVALTRK